MRTLPDSASLEHLRRQAKDLRASLRRSEPSITLTEAQTALARQYGYKTWSELKQAAEEQRALPPVVAAEELAAALARQFGLGRPASQMVRVDRTWAGSVWELETTTGGRVVLTELAAHVQPADIETEAGLVEQAMKAGVKAPPPVRTGSGAVIVDVEGISWRAHRWIKLGPASVRPAEPDVAHAAGRTLAVIHALRLPPPGPVVPWLSRRPSVPAWQALADQCREHQPDWLRVLERAVAGFLAFEPLLDDADPNPRAVLSHAWIAPDTVRAAGPGAVVVCGWEHASATPPDWELASSVLAWSESGDGDLAPEPGQAFLDGYRAGGGTAGEGPLPVRMFTSAVTNHINWTASRVNIALNHSDPAEREQAARAVPGLLANPLTVDRLSALLDALR